MKPETYLKKAMRRSNGYTSNGGFKTIEGPFQGEIFPWDKGGFATNAEVAFIDYNYDGDFTDTPSPIDLKSLRTDLDCRFVVSKEHFLRAVKAAHSIRPLSVKVNANGWLETMAQGKYGNSHCGIRNMDTWKLKSKDTTVLYRKLGKDVSLLLDPRYLLDAISAMGDILIVSVYGYLVVIQDDNREAWIMQRRG